MTPDEFENLAYDLAMGSGPNADDIIRACDDLVAQARAEERAKVERLRLVWKSARRGRRSARRLNAELVRSMDMLRAELAETTHVLAVTGEKLEAVRGQRDRAEAGRDRLTEQVKRVRELHSPEEDPRRNRDCKGCRTVATYTPYEDCKTIAALGGTEPGQ